MSDPSTDNSPPDHSTPSARGILGYLDDWRLDFVDCLAFFTRLPVPPLLGPRSESVPKFERASRALPLIGLLLSVIALVPATLFDVLALTAPLPAQLMAAMTLFTMVVITGGLHEDGLADLADGFWGGGDTTRKLEIMKDSRLGTYGALALCFSLLMRFAILSYLFANYGVQVGGLAYMAAVIVSRVPQIHIWYILPPARTSGLSAAAGQPAMGAYGVALSLGALATVILIVPIFGLLSAVAAFVMVVLTSLYMVYLSKKHIKGQTGDVLGAAQQMGEIAFGIGLLLFAAAGW